MDYVICYIDDICIASKSQDEHYHHVRAVLQRLREYGLKLNVAKCVFAQEKVLFLGHEVCKEGIHPATEKVEAIVNFPRPVTTNELRRFIAMCNFYRRFLPKAAATQGRLQSLIKGNIRNDKTPITWTDDADKAFNECKRR